MMEDEVNPLERDYSLSVVLPGGLERNTMVHGSKPVMDLLVTLCARYHLNPSDHTVEILSANKNIISFKPNSPIGSLEAEKILLKPKSIEEKPKRTYMPEASVRLLINYRKSHKAVVRVNPGLPLGELLPEICRKCELNVETTVLLRDAQARQPLDLTACLNKHGLREVFAKDTAAVAAPEVFSQSPAQAMQKKEKKAKEKENKGFLGLFKRQKKRSEMAGCVPSSPGGGQQRQHLSASVSSLGLRSPNTPSTFLADLPKKRRAPPPPPPAVSQSVPDNLCTRNLVSQSSAESTLARTKRRAPPPPPPVASLDTEDPDTLDSLHSCQELGEVQESDSVSESPTSSSNQPTPHLFSSPMFPTPLPPGALCVGKELPQARFALAKILTTSACNGKLAERLKSLDAFSKLRSGSCGGSLAQKRTDDGGSFACLEDYTCNLSSHDLEWEDPRQRKGLTTFKVVPSVQRSFEVEVTLEVPVPGRASEDDHPVGQPDDNRTPESQASPKSPDYEIAADNSEVSPMETRVPNNEPSLPSSLEESAYRDGVPASRGPPSYPERLPSQSSPLAEADKEPGRSEDVESAAVTSQLHPEDCPVENDAADENGLNADVTSPSPQSPSGQTLDPEVSSSSDEEEDNGVLLDECEDNFPPPPPPVVFNEELERAEAASRSPCSPTFSRGARLDDLAFPTAAVAEPMPLKKVSAVPNRFAQAVALAVQRGGTDNKGQGLRPPQVTGGPQSLFSTANTRLLVSVNHRLIENERQPAALSPSIVVRVNAGRLTGFLAHL